MLGVKRITPGYIVEEEIQRKKLREREREGLGSWRKICGGKGKQDARRHLKKIREKGKRGIKMREETAVSEERRMKLKVMEEVKIEETD